MFQNRNVLVVGAGRYAGIGAAICRRLASQGMNVVVSSCLDYDKSFIDQVQYERLRDDCIKYGVLCEWIDCDVRKFENISKIFDFAEETFSSPVDTFIYCS